MGRKRVSVDSKFQSKKVLRLKVVSSDPNLATLLLHTFKGLLLQNSPKLVELSIVCAHHGTRIKDVAPALSCCINQLEKLTLRLYAPDEIIVLSEFLQLPKLKRLVVEYWGQSDESLMGPTSFIRAFPCLQEFVLEYCGGISSQGPTEKL
ncbi:hypothetical protein OROMI_019050 [Orobanche minor]